MVEGGVECLAHRVLLVARHRIERALGDAGTLRDLGHRGMREARLGDNLGRGVESPCALQERDGLRRQTTTTARQHRSAQGRGRGIRV